MAITAKAPRGGLVETIDEQTYVFKLRNREIERFEDAHRSIFDLSDGFQGRGKTPSYQEVRDLVALALVGGGLADEKADKVISDTGPDSAKRLFAIASAALGVAFFPDLLEQLEKEKGAKPTVVKKKKKSSTPKATKSGKS